MKRLDIENLDKCKQSIQFSVYERKGFRWGQEGREMEIDKLKDRIFGVSSLENCWLGVCFWFWKGNGKFYEFKRLGKTIEMEKILKMLCFFQSFMTFEHQNSILLTWFQTVKLKFQWKPEIEFPEVDRERLSRFNLHRNLWWNL